MCDIFKHELFQLQYLIAYDNPISDIELLIKNARIVNPWGTSFGDVLIDHGIITEIGEPKIGSTSCNVIDAEGDILLPGFIDVHIQGAGGADILDGEDAVETISESCIKHGVTGFLATTVYKPRQDNKHIEDALRRSSEGLSGAKMLGIHLEGPFISEKRKGMIQSSSICEPSEKVLSDIMHKCKGQLKMMTLAPEIEGIQNTIRLLIESNVVVSFGHSSASYEQTLNAIRAGVKHVTHIFNAMPPIHHRDPGPLLAIFESAEVTAQLISDGVHIHPSVVRFAYRVLGDDRIVLITDGVRSTGLPDGRYTYDCMEFISVGGTAKYVDGTLIGTSAGMNELARRYIDFTGLPLSSVAKVASYNPAKLLGLVDKKGSVEVGKDADLILIGEDFKVRMTFVKGRPV
ncbi:MAG: N-acetylglucosamine-6-phosphate deacetylase [Candidatus Bathyarchaeia archaeon]